LDLLLKDLYTSVPLKKEELENVVAVPGQDYWGAWLSGGRGGAKWRLSF